MLQTNLFGKGRNCIAGHFFDTPIPGMCCTIMGFVQNKAFQTNTPFSLIVFFISKLIKYLFPFIFFVLLFFASLIDKCFRLVKDVVHVALREAHFGNSPSLPCSSEYLSRATLNPHRDKRIRLKI